MGRKDDRVEVIDAIDLFPDAKEGALASAIDHDGTGHYYAMTADGWKTISHKEHHRRVMEKYVGNIEDVFRG
jgi:hypothetical protein